MRSGRGRHGDCCTHSERRYGYYYGGGCFDGQNVNSLTIGRSCAWEIKAAADSAGVTEQRSRWEVMRATSRAGGRVVLVV